MMIFKKKILSITILLTLLLMVGCLKSNEENLDKLKLEGQWSYANDDNLVVFDLHEKSKQTIYSTEGTAEGVGYFDVSPNNKAIIFSLINIIKGEKMVLLEKNSNSPNALIDYGENVCYRGISWSPDGSKIAIVKCKPDTDRLLFELYVMSPQGTGVKKISKVNLYLGKPSWSPDSKRIAFTGYGSMDWTMRGDDEISKEGISALDLGIYIVNVKTGTTERIIVSGYSPAWSPDGQSIAYYEPVPYSNKEKLNMFNIEKRSVKTLLKAGAFGNSIAWSPDGKYLLYPRYKMIFMPPEKQVFEVYSMETKKSYRIFEVGSVNDFVWSQSN